MTATALLNSTAKDKTAPPPVMLPYQQRWIADKSQLKVIEKSRRTGITWGEAADNVLTAASDRTAGGQNVYYVGYNQDMTMEYIDACAMWARAFGHAASEIGEEIWQDGDKHIKTFVIRFPQSGFRITALTSRPSNLRGRQGVVVLDEAAFHESLDELLKAALALMIWGGSVHVISTHNGDDNPFNELVNEIRSGKRKGSIQRITFDEAVTEGLYQQVCLRRGIDHSMAEEQAWKADIYQTYGDAASEELDVIPSKGGGRWLSQGLLERVQNEAVPVLRFEAPKGFDTWSEDARTIEVTAWCDEHLHPVLAHLPSKVSSYYGLDFARRRDACVFWPLLERQDTRKACPFVLEMHRVPYKQQEQIMLYVVKALPDFRKGAHDATGNGGYLAEAMQVKYGERVEAIMLSEGWYRDHTPAFKAALEDGDIVDMPQDKDILDDHRAFTLVKGVARIPDQ
ncbi:MAG: hypothetical protein RLY58_1262, partial [Pseudomonadota bacterium]